VREPGLLLKRSEAFDWHSEVLKVFFLTKLRRELLPEESILLTSSDSWILLLPLIYPNTMLFFL